MSGRVVPRNFSQRRMTRQRHSANGASTMTMASARRAAPRSPALTCSCRPAPRRLGRSRPAAAPRRTRSSRVSNPHSRRVRRGGSRVPRGPPPTDERRSSCLHRRTQHRHATHLRVHASMVSGTRDTRGRGRTWRTDAPISRRARRTLRRTHQIGYVPRPETPGRAPVELQGAFAACDATSGVDEPADPSRRTRRESSSVVRWPDTGGWLQTAQLEQGCASDKVDADPGFLQSTGGGSIRRSMPPRSGPPQPVTRSTSRPTW
jgi:hypothetical protein